MTRPFAPPELFAAVAGYPLPSDEDLTEGTHLRLLPSPALGFPLAPFAVWHGEIAYSGANVVWTDAWGRFIGAPGPPNLDENGGELHCYIHPWDENERSLVVAVRVQPSDQPFEIAAIDGAAPNRSSVIVKRSESPWMVAAPTLAHLRARGRGYVSEIVLFKASEELVGAEIGAEPDTLLSLPVEGFGPWYAGGLGPAVAFERVKRGAPRRLGPPDEPGGPVHAVSEADEVDRVGVLAADIDRRLADMLADRDLPPWIHRDPAATPDRSQRTSFKTAAGMILQGLDPGIGHYLGLTGTFDAQPASSESPPLLWIAASMFALDPLAILPDGRSVQDAFAAPDPFAQQLEQRLLEVSPGVSQLADEQRAAGRLVVPLAAVAAGPPLPDRPDPPNAVAGAAQWMLTDPLPSTSFRQELLVRDAPLAPLIALARQVDGDWQSLHRKVELPGGQERAIPLLFGRNRNGDGILVDAPVPETPDPTYAICLGDLYGRYGEPIEQGVTAPPRPGPPRPAPQIEIERAAVAGDAPASAGTLVVRVPVPAVEQLPPGARPIDTVEATFDGALQSEGAAAVTELSFTLRELAPGRLAEGALTVWFCDDSGTKSEQATQLVRFADARPPRPLDAGVGIIWTSRPGPDEEVALKLNWTHREGERYRAFVTDARNLVQGGGGRGAEAQALSQLGAIDKRGAFRLLTDPPLEADGSGHVHLDARLPRSLETVQAVRLLPVSAGNVEAEFARCPLVPVAVPSSRRPPPPRLSVTVDHDTGRARIAVLATGLDREALSEAEPGLWEQPPSAEAQWPEFRLRRAVGEVVDPVYAREVKRAPLELATGPGGETFLAEFDDGPPSGLRPYVRYVYWAEVRMPPERRLPVGVEDIPLPGAIAPSHPAQQKDMPGLFSLASAPAHAMRVPREVPALSPAHARAILAPDAAPGSVRLALSIFNAPKAHQRAVDSYRLQIWVREGSSPIRQLTKDGSLPAVHGALQWSSDPFAPADPAAPVSAFLAVVDPLGRRGEILELTADPLPLEPGWRRCGKCQLLTSPGATAGPCPAGGVHDHAASDHYELPHDVTAPATEPGWRRCSKCTCVEWAGDGSSGACTAGGQHEHAASRQYSVPLDLTPAGAQSGWRRCDRCRSLVYAGNPTPCPAGGPHLFAHSGVYSVYVANDA